MSPQGEGVVCYTPCPHIFAIFNNQTMEVKYMKTLWHWLWSLLIEEDDLDITTELPDDTRPGLLFYNPSRDRIEIWHSYKLFEAFRSRTKDEWILIGDIQGD